MFRNNSTLVLLTALLLCSITVADSQFFYLEQEELKETREIELKEGGEDWIKLTRSGFDGGITEKLTFLQQSTIFHIQEIVQVRCQQLITQLPFFIKYCSLKIPLL